MRARVALAALLGALCLTASAQAAGEFEPNDTPEQATGPLASATPYAAAIERRGESDFYFLYVTSPGPSQVTLALENRGGGPASSLLNAVLTDASGNQVDALQYIDKGRRQSATLALAPQKYLVEVTGTEAFNDEGAGDSYALTVSGEGIAPYGRIAARCVAARKRTATTRRASQRLQFKRQRSIARLRLLRFSPPKARRRARVAYRRLVARLTRTHRAQRAAARSQRPWCEIPR